MEVATAKEARALTNKTKAITPGTLKEVLSSYATQEYAREHGGEGHSSSLINDVKVNGTSVVTNKVAYVSVPTALSELTNDTDFVQKVNNYIPSELIPEAIKNQITEVNGQLPTVGTIGRLYIKTDVNKIYRWNAITSEYVEVSEQLSLGESSSQAYWGDKGKIAYDHAQIRSGNPHGLTLETFDITVDAYKINYLTDVTSNIGAALNSKLNLSGGTMTGPLILYHGNNYTPGQWDAIYKQYVDDKYNDTIALITVNVQNTKSLAQYIDGYISDNRTKIDTVGILQNKLEGYDTYIQCPTVTYMEGVDYYEQVLTSGYELTDDILFVGTTSYYELIEGSYIAVPYNSSTHMFTLNNGTECYEGDILRPSYQLYTQYNNIPRYDLLTPGSDYIIGDIIYDLTEDTTYQANKTYYIIYEDSWKELVVGEDYEIGESIPANTIYEFNNIYTLQQVDGLDQAAQRSEEFIHTQESTNKQFTDSYKAVDLLVQSLNTTVNGGDIFVKTNDTTFQTDKTYYYLDTTDDTDKIYTDYDIGDPITIDLFETQLQESLSSVIDNKYQDVVDMLADYPTTQNVTEKISEVKKTITPTYSRTEIQNILRGVGFVLTDDKTYKENKEYYNADHEKLTGYTIGDTIPVGTSGLNETVFEKVETSSFRSKAGTFSDNGLTIEEKDEEGNLIGLSSSNLDTNGLDVRAITNGVKADEPTLYAGINPDNANESIVKTTNLNVKTYLYTADEHLRFEKYTDPSSNIEGWGGFYL